MMYDWANSAHSVIVVTILPIFYNTVAEYTGDAVSSMSTWGYATSAAMASISCQRYHWVKVSSMSLPTQRYSSAPG